MPTQKREYIKIVLVLSRMGNNWTQYQTYTAGFRDVFRLADRFVLVSSLPLLRNWSGFLRPQDVTPYSPFINLMGSDWWFLLRNIELNICDFPKYFVLLMVIVSVIAFDLKRMLCKFLIEVGKNRVVICKYKHLKALLQISSLCNKICVVTYSSDK